MKQVFWGSTAMMLTVAAMYAGVHYYGFGAMSGRELADGLLLAAISAAIMIVLAIAGLHFACLAFAGLAIAAVFAGIAGILGTSAYYLAALVGCGVTLLGGFAGAVAKLKGLPVRRVQLACIAGTTGLAAFVVLASLTGWLQALAALATAEGIMAAAWLVSVRVDPKPTTESNGAGA
ncbi:MAG: hypothetical protein Q8P78_02660 [bacterium]|nr:hypothetical protein [bacterium]